MKVVLDVHLSINVSVLIANTNWSLRTSQKGPRWIFFQCKLVARYPQLSVMFQRMFYKHENVNYSITKISISKQARKFLIKEGAVIESYLSDACVAWKNERGGGVFDQF